MIWTAKGYAYSNGGFLLGCCWLSPTAVRCLMSVPISMFGASHRCEFLRRLSDPLPQIIAFCLLLAVSQWPRPQLQNVALPLFAARNQVESELRRRGNTIAALKPRLCV